MAPEASDTHSAYQVVYYINVRSGVTRKSYALIVCNTETGTY